MANEPNAPPVIFDNKGAFVEPDPQIIASLDEETRARLDAVRTVYNNLLTAQAKEKAATEEIPNAQQAVADAQAYRLKYYPPQTPHELWLDSFGSEKDRANSRTK